jgi:hypothetical protein
MIMRMIKSIKYTRQVYKISKELGSEQSISLEDKSTEKALAKMKELWAKNDLLSPVLKKHGETPESLEEYYWELSLNGAGQWVGGYFVAVAALCFPLPLEYALSNKSSPKRETTFNLLQYFEQGNPYLPIS